MCFYSYKMYKFKRTVNICNELSIVFLGCTTTAVPPRNSWNGPAHLLYRLPWWEPKQNIMAIDGKQASDICVFPLINFRKSRIKFRVSGDFFPRSQSRRFTPLAFCSIIVTNGDLAALVVSSGAEVDAEGAGAERTAPLGMDRTSRLKRRHVFYFLVVFAVDLVLLWIVIVFLGVVMSPRCLFVLYN